jgi:DNA-binding CsgD family transcriptional regulator
MDRVFEVDLRALVRMLADVAAEEDSRFLKRNRILAGLSDLIGAEFWFWGCKAAGGESTWDNYVWGNSQVKLGKAVADRLFEEEESRIRGVGPVLSWLGAAGNGGWCGVALGRMPGRAEFSERERDLAEMVVEEIPWLLEPDDDRQPANDTRLSQRQELTLEYLLRGMPRKEIADHMGVSINTVAGYVRDVYQSLGVRSHPELMRRVLGAAR